MFVKVCGVTTVEQLEWAIELGYDAVGLMRAPKSSRYVDLSKAHELLEVAAGRIKTFAVALSLDQVEPLVAYVDTIQLYEWADVPSLALAADEPPVSTEGLEYWFYDASHGTGTFGEIPDWVRSVDAKVVLAGGLNPQNVGEVVRLYKPAGVDVSSGVERVPGVKDYMLMKSFIEAVRGGSAV